MRKHPAFFQGRIIQLQAKRSARPTAPYKKTPRMLMPRIPTNIVSISPMPQASMMSHPRLLMLDEPSMGLAPILVDQIFDIIKQLHENGTTILLVEQNARKALQIADRAYVLETGSITLSGTGAELASSDAVRKAYLGG